MTKIERMYLEERILRILTEKGLGENVLDDFENERNLKNEVNEYIEAFGEELLEEIENLDNKIDEFFCTYKVLEKVIEEDINISEKIIYSAEETLKEIEELEEEVANRTEKNKVMEKLAERLIELKEKIREQIEILKQRFFDKKIENTKNNDLLEKEELFLSSLDKLPKSAIKDLVNSKNIRVLRNLARKDYLDKEDFIKLASTKDIKVKEFILDNKNTPKEVVSLLFKEKDTEIKKMAIMHPNLDDKIKDKVLKSGNIEYINILAKKDNVKDLEYIYNNYNGKKIIYSLAENEKTPHNILLKLEKINDEKIREKLINNKIFQENKRLQLPEVGDNNKLYKKLLEESDFRKNQLEKFFERKIIYADKDGNAIFPVWNNAKDLLGYSKINFAENKVEKFGGIIETSSLANDILKNFEAEKEVNISNKEIYLPEVGDNNKLYQFLLMHSDLKKDEVVKMFAKNKIYADKEFNAVFPIKNKEDKVIGIYSLDVQSPNKEIKFSANGTLGDEFKEVEDFIYKVKSSLQKEESEKDMEEEINL